MRKPVTKEYQEALRKAINDVGGQSELSRRSRVGQSTINGILNKKGKEYMLDSIYEKLLPYVAPFMTNVTINGDSAIINAPRDCKGIGIIKGKLADQESADDFYDRIVACDTIPAEVKVELYKLLKQGK